MATVACCDAEVWGGVSKEEGWSVRHYQPGAKKKGTGRMGRASSQADDSLHFFTEAFAEEASKQAAFLLLPLQKGKRFPASHSEYCCVLHAFFAGDGR